MSIYLNDFLDRGTELPKAVEENCEAIRQLDLYTQGGLVPRLDLFCFSRSVCVCVCVRTAASNIKRMREAHCRRQSTWRHRFSLPHLGSGLLRIRRREPSEPTTIREA